MVFLKATIWVASVAKAAIAAAVLAIVATQLLNVTVDTQISTQKQTVKPVYSCLMTDDTSNPAVCNYALVAASFSLVATAAVSILQCVTCDLCGCGATLDFVLGAVGAGWWLMASFLFKKNIDAANAATPLVPNQVWRDRVLYLAYAEVPLFALVCVVALFKGMMWCCGGKKDKYNNMA